MESSSPTMPARRMAEETAATPTSPHTDGQAPRETSPVHAVATVPGVPIASVTDLVKVYGSGDAQVRALDGLSAEFAAGTFTAIMGPSGSGKSTLMHMLAGLDTPTSGHVRLAGTALETLDDNRLTVLRRDQVGFIFQSFNLLPTHTARQNIVLPLELAGRKPDTDAFEALVASLGLTGRLDHLPSQLSGGEQQRVAVARALITQPAVVVADEPTGALDSRTSARLLGYLREASASRGQTIIMVTHDPRAAAYAARALILSDGRIVDDIDRPDAAVVLDAMRALGGGE
ncbi:MAG: ABC transporter ATP-binding protein [Actinomycetia bacterium]|nr:ABC transporter ATP-binding protein [Actinomycetes bacterium]